MTLKKKKTVDGKNTRSDLSRQRILTAARTVFVRYPYGAAGVRKIEEEGGFNYALIRYYFGSKKGLFEAVSLELVNEYIHFLLPTIKTALDNNTPELYLNRFVDELFDFGFDHSDGPSMIMLNIGQAQLFDGTLLGLSAMRRYFSQVTKMFIEALSFPVVEQEVAMWVFVFTILFANFIGAKAFHATALNLDPESDEYRAWVKTSVLSMFAPVLERVLYGRGVDPEITISKEANAFLNKMSARGETSTKRKTKGDITCEKILSAAQSVFSTRPYDMASIRQVGHEGGFDFTLIHHYFPTKQDLVEAVWARFYNDFFQQSALWFSLIQDNVRNRVPLLEGLSVYIRSLLDYLFDNQHGPATMMQNIAQSNPRRTLPAFELSLRFYTDIFNRLKHLLPIKAPEKEIRMWQYCLVVVIANCVGAPDYPARIIALSPRGSRYREWITTALVRLFYPGLKNMVTTAAAPHGEAAKDPDSPL